MAKDAGDVTANEFGFYSFLVVHLGIIIIGVVLDYFGII